MVTSEFRPHKTFSSSFVTIGEVMVRALTVLLALATVPAVVARSWEDVVSPTVLNPLDVETLRYLQSADPFHDNLILLGPSATRTPTEAPTWAPTRQPTTATPTSTPTAVPTTATPTESPDPYPQNPVPNNPRDWYFNYDTSDGTNHGPGELALVPMDGTFKVGIKNNNWGSVGTLPNDYWKEFTDKGFGPWKGTLQNHNVYRNVCETGGMQSPIDLKENGAKCDEHHEVRSLPGDYRVTSDEVQKRIESNKLRLVYKRRPCADLENVACQEPDPPYADFPNGWGGFADVTHIDFKVPSEHTIWGERFDAEMQIFHIHTDRRRMPTQSVLIRARDDGYNYYFQEALNAFQFEYDMNKAHCAFRQRRERQLMTDAHTLLRGSSIGQNATDFDAWAEYSTEFERPDYEEYSTKMKRLLNNKSWDPHHEMLIPTIHFFRYDGSLTEPPCGEWVSWFVADKPMIISHQQLEQMKTILFTNYDAGCHKTSVQFDHSVARPIRPTGRRPVWKCTRDDFGPDP